MWKIRSTLSWCVFAILAIVISSQPYCTEGSLPFGSDCIQVQYVQGCASYSRDAQCEICEYGYVKTGKSCEYTPNKPGNCCAKFSLTGECQVCAPGLYLNGNTCYSSVLPGCLLKKDGLCLNCASGFYNNKGNCQKKVIGCSEHTDKGICKVCQLGWLLDRGMCYKKTSIEVVLTPNCLYSNQYTCTQCLPNYYLTKNGGCIRFETGCIKYWREQCMSCESNLKLLNGKCTIDGCDKYGEKGCSVCKAPYYQINGGCKIENCYEASSGKCKICDANYRLKGGLCVRAIEDACRQCAKGYILGQDGRCYVGIIGCLNYGNSGCQKCKNNFYITQNKCVIPGCDVNTFSDAGCEKCLAPFVPTNDKSCTIKYCQVINWQGCERCSNGYHEEKGDCIINIPGCIVYNRIDLLNEVCSKCRQDLVLTNDGRCIDQTPGCVYQDNICFSCFYPFLRDQNGKCWIPGCQKYNMKGCEVCASPYIQKNGQCKIQYCAEVNSNYLCSRCDDGYRLFAKLGVCLAFEPYCLDYSKDNGQCNLCQPKYVLNNNKNCIRMIPYCSQLDNYGGCSKCQTGYNLIQGACQIADPYCKQPSNLGCGECLIGYHMELGQCIRNQPNCLSYGKISNLQIQVCEVCIDGFYLNEKYQCLPASPGCNYQKSVCVSCKKPFLYNSDKKQCYISGCESYSMGGCSVCSAPFVVSDGICSIAFCAEYSYSSCARCLEGYSVVNGGCMRKDIRCVEYNAYGDCKLCIKDYVLFEGVCIKQDKFCLQYSRNGGCNKCQDSYYISDDRVCLPKEPGCIYQKNICTYCQQPFQMHEESKKCRINGCLQTNLNGCLTCKFPFQLTKNNQCLIPYCLSEKNGACLRCSMGYHLREGRFCKKDQENCLKYNDDGDCELCAKNYIIMSNGQCELAEDNCIRRSNDGRKCLACVQNYFLNIYHQCQRKDDKCIEYNNGICSKCDLKYFLYDYICFPYSAGCIKYAGKNCVQCKKAYTLNNGECFLLKKPLLKMEGDGDNYDFQITPIDITKSKYYIDNLSPVSQIGKLIYSSVYSNDYKDASLTNDDGTTGKGWRAQNSRANQYIGFSLDNQEPATFFAVQIQAIQSFRIKQFSIEYSVDGINYIRISQTFTLTQKQTIQTVYFTGIYAKSIRIVITGFEGWPACRIDFFYYDYLRFRKISNLKSLRYLKESIDSNFVDRVDNQMYINQRYFFKPETDCTDKDVCWTGLQLCQARPISNIRVLTGSKNSAGLSYLSQFYVMYSLDGRIFNCYQQCRKFKIPVQQFYDLKLQGVSAKNLRIYPTGWVGKPQFSVVYNYQ